MVSKVVARSGPKTEPSPEVLSGVPLSGAGPMGEHGGMGGYKEAKCHAAPNDVLHRPTITKGPASPTERVSALREAISVIPSK